MVFQHKSIFLKQFIVKLDNIPINDILDDFCKI